MYLNAYIYIIQMTQIQNIMKAAKTFKSETAKQFLSENRNLVFTTLKNKFWDKTVNFNELVNSYFSYILESKYNKYFTAEMEAKDLKKVIEYSVDAFETTTNYPKNYTAINDFADQREAAKWGSKSF